VIEYINILDSSIKTKMYDVVFIGAGPSALCGANYLKTYSNVSFLLIDKGKEIEKRDHESEIDIGCGIGGNGLFSDGKFSYFPAGSEVWKLEKEYVLKAYEHLRKIMKPFHDIPELTELDYISTEDECWKIKNYVTHYLSLAQRYSMIKSLMDGYEKQFLLETEVYNVKKEDGHYLLYCKNVNDDTISQISAKKVVFAGGRFVPLFLRKLGWIPMEFKRVELGVRFEGPSSSEIYDISSNVDPKFLKVMNGCQYITFCWCRKGETKYSNFNGIKTWSGRSDCVPTEKSNFGFNVKFRHESSVEMLEKAIHTEIFDVEFQKDEDIPESYKEIYSHIKKGLSSFLEFSKIDKDKLTDFRIKGPTIEGVGYYPVTDESLKIPSEDIYILGDSSGKFRGIIASMMSGLFVSQKIISEKKKNVVLLSGKRFSGKGQSSLILKKYFESKGKRVHITCFSYFLKEQFCKLNGIDFDRFINDHEFKDSFRDRLTAYLDTCEYSSFTAMLEHAIDTNKFDVDPDVYIIDDLRCYESQIKYIHDRLLHKWNIVTLRINSKEETRAQRGWIKSDYDDHMCENDLDDYTKFDHYIPNDDSIEELEKKLISINIEF
jgi:phosphomevalonate kinase